jgi:cephalosporin hydroxylase
MAAQQNTQYRKLIIKWQPDILIQLGFKGEIIFFAAK